MKENKENSFCKDCKSPVCTHKGNVPNYSGIPHCSGKFVSIISIIDGEKHVVEYECFPVEPNFHTYDYEAWYKGKNIEKLEEKWVKHGTRKAWFKDGVMIKEEKSKDFPWG